MNVASPAQRIVCSDGSIGRISSTRSCAVTIERSDAIAAAIDHPMAESASSATALTDERPSTSRSQGGTASSSSHLPAWKLITRNPTWSWSGIAGQPA